MIDALMQSNEPPELVKKAKAYVRGIRGHLVASRRNEERAAANPHAANQQNGIPNASALQPPSSGPPWESLSDRLPHHLHPPQSSIPASSPQYLSAPPYPLSSLPASVPVPAPTYTHSPYASGAVPPSPGAGPASTSNKPIIDLTDEQA